MSNETQAKWSSKGVPFEQAWTLPESTMLEFLERLLAWGIFGGLGVTNNILSIFVLVKCRLTRIWTYGLILNLSVADLMFCTNSLVFWLPGVLLGR